MDFSVPQGLTAFIAAVCSPVWTSGDGILYAQHNMFLVMPEHATYMKLSGLNGQSRSAGGIPK